MIVIIKAFIHSYAMPDRRVNALIIALELLA
jgi:hypothetical protein